MTRVFERRELVAAADKASAAARADVLSRFYVPIVGTLRCKFLGTRDPEANDLIVYDTNVVFLWELSAPHVKGSVEQAFFLRAGTQGRRQQRTAAPLSILSFFARPLECGSLLPTSGSGGWVAVRVL